MGDEEVLRGDKVVERLVGVAAEVERDAVDGAELAKVADDEAAVFESTTKV